MYKVIKFFTDLQDNNHPYEVGSTYPREGLKVSKARIDELKSSKNKQGTPLIVGASDEKEILGKNSENVLGKEYDAISEKSEEKVEKKETAKDKKKGK